MSEVDLLQRWTERVGALNVRLQPLVERPVEVGDPGWVARLTANHPLDESGARAEVEKLVLEIVEHYGEVSDERRTQIRRLFDRNRAFAWAATLPERPASAVSVRQDLLLFSILDLGRDSRDALLWLISICKCANLAGVDAKPMLEEIAAMSNHHNKHGMGSARELLLRAI